jgi:uncharacterized protein
MTILRSALGPDCVKRRAVRFPIPDTGNLPLWVSSSLQGGYRRGTNMPEQIDRLGRSGLHYAAAHGDEGEVGRLLASGEDPDLRDPSGWTPLHFGAQASSAAVVQLLLGAGADPNARDTDGNNPLFRAVFASRGDGAVIKLLLQAGSDARVRNRHGVSPLELARSIANYDLARYFPDVLTSSGDSGDHA